MHAVMFEEKVDEIVSENPRYPKEAYLFLREALAATQKSLGRDTKDRDKHVTGQELVTGIRNFALDQFGPMTMTVFEEWGIRTCEDFGEMVFALVAKGVLGKTDRDSRADFVDGYSFEDAFRKPFLPQKSVTLSPAPVKTQ